MLYGRIFALYFKNHTELIKKDVGQNAEIQTGGIYSNREVSMVNKTTSHNYVRNFNGQKRNLNNVE